MKGLFIPEITAEMFKSGCLESIEALMAAGEIYDIEYQRWIPCSEGLPEKDGWCLVTTYSSRGELMVSIASYYSIPKIFEDFGDSTLDVIAWMPYPEPYNPNQSVNQIDAAQPDSLVRSSARWVSVGHKRARICSHCFRDEPYKFADHDADVYDFCPHCGAKMEVDDE